MSIRLRDTLMHELGELRHEPTQKRIRATLGEQTVVDSTRALLVWEPVRVVPTYAVPEEDVDATIAPAAPEDAPTERPAGVAPMGAPRLGDLRVLDPSVPFAVHTTEGEPVEVVAGDGRTAAAFRPRDPALAGYVLLDFDAFDAWYEEDERNVGHPRDPFHRIDIVHSSRHVVVEVAGETVAESARPCLVFEPPLPVRWYLPLADVRAELLRPSAKRSVCAYKGEASYWSVGAEEDVAWSYPEPLREAAEVAGRVAFLDERVDVVVDGTRLERPVTPWSPR
jgi:uncharacterized protein (DUF427 family)